MSGHRTARPRSILSVPIMSSSLAVFLLCGVVMVQGKTLNTDLQTGTLQDTNEQGTAPTTQHQKIVLGVFCVGTAHKLRSPAGRALSRSGCAVPEGTRKMGVERKRGSIKKIPNFLYEPVTSVEAAEIMTSPTVKGHTRTTSRPLTRPSPFH